MCATDELQGTPDHTSLDLGIAHSREILSVHGGLTQDFCFSLREEVVKRQTECKFPKFRNFD